MSKKILGIVAAGLLSGMGAVANASILTPTYDSSWQTFSYDASSYIGGTLLIGVSDVKGYTSGDSILNLKNLVGLDLLVGDVFISNNNASNSVVLGTVGGDVTTVEMHTLDSNASSNGAACKTYVSPSKLGGDCSYVTFKVTGKDVTLDWQMLQDAAAPVAVTDALGNSGTAQDFAFYKVTLEPNSFPSYLQPKTRDVPEPSTIALMAVGLLGAGIAARRKKV